MSHIDPFYPYPPAQVQTYVDVMGIPTTIEFLLNFGGAELSISEGPKGKGMVERVIGHELTANLGRSAHLLQRRVPLANKWLAQCLFAQGISAAAIARRLRLTDVTVRRYVHGSNRRWDDDRD